MSTRIAHFPHNFTIHKYSQYSLAEVLLRWACHRHCLLFCRALLFDEIAIGEFERFQLPMHSGSCSLMQARESASDCALIRKVS